MHVKTTHLRYQRECAECDKTEALPADPANTNKNISKASYLVAQKYTYSKKQSPKFAEREGVWSCKVKPLTIIVSVYVGNGLLRMYKSARMGKILNPCHNLKMLKPLCTQNGRCRGVSLLSQVATVSASPEKLFI